MFEIRDDRSGEGKLEEAQRYKGISKEILLSCERKMIKRGNNAICQGKSSVFMPLG
jgi:hypothetical protein